MEDKARRRELIAEYKEAWPDAGVYRIVNQRTNKSLLGSTTDLASVQSRVEFARATNSPSALDMRLAADIRRFGMDAFTFEVLETLEVSPTTSRAEILKDLATLESLWREKLGADLLY